MASRTAGQHSFARAPQVTQPRSSFDRSFGCKTTLDFGELVPIGVDECLPGDTINMRLSAFARLLTMKVPPLDNMYLDFFFFSVPVRLVWDNWEKFNGAQTDPGDSTDFTIPTMTAPVGGHANESLSDYLGIPTKVDGLVHSSLFHRGYTLVWNEWFRHQDLQDSIPVNTSDTSDDPADYPLLKRGKRHDYFTSALPFVQKGDPVVIGIGAEAPISITSAINVSGGDGDEPSFQGTGFTTSVRQIQHARGGTNDADWSGTESGAAVNMSWNDPALAITQTDLDNALAVADLGAATAINVNALREAVATQRLLEIDARGGTRYTEILKAHFGVQSLDQRLQRPEYLGGGSTPINTSPVPVTTTLVTFPGDLGAFGTASANGVGFTHSFTEHCLLFCLASARADLNYQQGLHKMFSRSTRYDHYLPALANLGEQAVLNKEIFANNDANDELTFGYQERWSEYRYKPSIVTGKLRSNDALSLDIWHLSQDFAALPALDADFIEEDPPISRIVTVPGEPHLKLDCFFKYKHARVMPTFSIPSLTGRF